MGKTGTALSVSEISSSISVQPEHHTLGAGLNQAHCGVAVARPTYRGAR